MTVPSQTDVVVIGGGPSGSTVSTLLTQHGYQVTLFERDRFPRFHIGESLIPCTYDVLKRLGMLPKLKGSHFVKKYSVQFVNARGKISEPFYFVEHKPGEASQTWQVRRSEFDQTMLDNAREHGVDVHEETRVLEVIFEDGRAVGVRIQHPQAGEREVRAKVVVDASGQSSMLIDRLGLRTWDPDLRKMALWTYFRGAKRGEGRDEGATLVLRTESRKGWFWYIPLHDDITSVGVVSDVEDIFPNGPGQPPEAMYQRQVDRCPGLKPLLEGAEQCDIFRIQKEYSYRAQKVAGDGWTLVGDAFGFLDPLYSSGVLLALKSGSLAADAIAEGLAAGDVSEARLRSWEADYIRGVDRMRRLVCEYYDGFSFGAFIRRHPHFKGAITDLLIGDLFREELDELWPYMDEMRAEMDAAAAQQQAGK